MYCDILRKPIVCLGDRLSKIFKQELTKVDTSDVKFITHKFSSGKNDLITPTVKLNAEVQKLLDQTLQHPQKAQIHFCSECPKCYESAKSLYGHVHLIHKGEFKFQCQKCHRKFLNKHHYKMHRRLHLNKLKYVCKKCDRCFVQKPLLDHHIATEHNCQYDCLHCDKKYASQKCDRRFVQKPLLDHHIATEHNCQYDCLHCDKKYASLKAMQSHLRAINYRYVCPKCKSNFASFQSCRQHSKVC